MVQDPKKKNKEECTHENLQYSNYILKKKLPDSFHICYSR